MDPIHSTSSHAASAGVSPTEKKKKFEELVNVANRILSPENMQLSSRDYNPKRDALAFLVEYAPFPDAQQWRKVMNQLVENLNKSENKHAATLLLKRSVDLAIQTAVSAAIEREPQRAQTWEDYLQMLRVLDIPNNERGSRGEPYDFTGVARELLPAWYLNEYGTKV